MYWIVSGIVALLAAFYIGLPLLIRTKLTISTDPSFKEVPENSPEVPEAAWNVFEEVSPTMQALGFSPPVYLVNRETMPGTTGYLAVFANPATRDLAAVMAVSSQPAPDQTMWTYAVDFSRELVDGTEMTTTNSSQCQWITPPAWKKAFRFPGLADIPKLHELHRAIVQRDPGAAARSVPAPGEYRARVREGVLREFQAQADDGYLHLDEQNQVFRYTIKGCMWATWGELPPFKSIRRSLMIGRARRLARELNVDVAL